MPITLSLIEGEFAICRLLAHEPLPAWTASTVFSAVMRTADELTVICPADQVPAAVKQETGWRLLKFKGPFAFTQTGILAGVLAPLAVAKISILAQSTFDTDYLLVKANQLELAVQSLTAVGHRVEREPLSKLTGLNDSK